MVGSAGELDGTGTESGTRKLEGMECGGKCRGASENRWDRMGRGGKETHGEGEGDDNES